MMDDIVAPFEEVVKIGKIISTGKVPLCRRLPAILDEREAEATDPSYIGQIIFRVKPCALCPRC